MEFSLENTIDYSQQQIDVLNEALEILVADKNLTNVDEYDEMEKAEELEELTDYYAEKLQKVWVEDESENTAEKLVNRVRKEF